LSQPNLSDLSALLDEIRRLLAQLDAARNDSRGLSDALKHVRSEAIESTRPLATHDPKS